MKFRDLLALRLGSAFRVSGLLVLHQGLIIDQTEIGRRISIVRDALAKRGIKADRLQALLGRTTLQLLQTRPAPGLDVVAGWTGGFWDRGEIRLRASEKWGGSFRKRVDGPALCRAGHRDQPGGVVSLDREALGPRGGPKDFGPPDRPLGEPRNVFANLGY